MKLNDMFPSRFLKADDLDGPILVTIKKVEMEKFDEQTTRPILHTQEAKPLVLNLTNARILEEFLGSDTDGWTGFQCVLYLDPNVTFKGERVGGVRIRPPKSKIAKPAAAKPAPKPAPAKEEVSAEASEEDDVPF